jgi:hypothetical protein
LTAGYTCRILREETIKNIMENGKMKKYLYSLISLLMCFTYCSSGSSNNSLTDLTLYSMPTQDGVVCKKTSGSGYGGDNTSEEGYIGDNYNASYINKTALSFDISLITSASDISAVTLRVYQSMVYGTPYTDLGNVFVDSIEYDDFLTDVASIYDFIPFGTATSALSSDPTIGWKEVDETALVNADISAGRSKSQFILRHNLATDGGLVADEDASYWYMSEKSAYKPELIIEY